MVYCLLVLILSVKYLDLLVEREMAKENVSEVSSTLFFKAMQYSPLIMLLIVYDFFVVVLVCLLTGYHWAVVLMN